MCTARFSYLKQHQAEWHMYPNFEELLYQLSISVKPPQFIQQRGQERARVKNPSLKTVR